MKILDFEHRELRSKREWPEGSNKKSNGISLELRRLRLNKPEIFDPAEYHKKRELSFEEYLERRKVRLMADAVLAVVVGSNLNFEKRVRFMARMHDIELIDRKPRGGLRIIK